MNAIQFIKDHGVEKAREVVSGAPEEAEVYTYRSKTYFSSPSCIYDAKLSAWEDMDRGMDLDLYEEQIWLLDLKRLVESVDLVDEQGGLMWARTHLSLSLARSNYIEAERLKQAIADYEAIYEIEN